ncbi:MAG TPA: peptidyl-prolyl cis-trans isomerase [Terriglobales bacterium]|nr:peptidyl-prolyl cis-trans isomerase [Terriglobales bacterium]
MRISTLGLLLISALAVGQATQKAPPATHMAPASPTQNSAAGGESAIAPDAAVITIPGVCDSAPAHPAASKAAKPASAGETCRTVITRSEFETLANALQPNMNMQTKRRLADIYPKMLVMAHEAKKRGLENDPKFKETLKFARLNILSQQLTRAVKDDADNVPAAEIEKYYKDNPAAFEQASLQRIFIPKEKQHEPAKVDAAAKDAIAEDSAKQAEIRKADEEAMKTQAESVQKRAAAGEDFDKLQKETYDAAGVKGTPPPTNIGKLTRNEIPVSHRAVFDLKPGEVSQLFSESNGYYVYKLVSKETKPLDQARDEIRTNLAQQRMKDAMEKIQEEAQPKLNDAYFGAATPPAPPQMAPPQTPATPAAPPKPPSQGQTGAQEKPEK